MQNYMICSTLFIMAVVFMNGLIVCRHELWDGVSPYFIKDGPVTVFSHNVATMVLTICADGFTNSL